MNNIIRLYKAVKNAILRQTPVYDEQKLVAAIKDLWQIIDDIDTYTDMAKSNDQVYRKLVERRQNDRWKTKITTDGYTLDLNALK